MFIQGAKVGYGRTSTKHIDEHGQRLVEIEEQVSFSVNRNGQRTEQKINSTGVETPQGDLLRFRTEILSGAEAIVTTGKVGGGQLVFATTTTGKTTPGSMPWMPGTGGFKATEHSLSSKPMQPGERRKLSSLMVGFNQVANIELVAGAYETTMLLDHSEDLLHVDWMATLPGGNAIRSIWWTNHEGGVMKMQIDALNQVTYRVSKEVAIDDAGRGQFDLLLSTTVPVSRAIEHSTQTRRVRYRVQLASEDPSRVFVSGASQQVTSLDPHTAEIVVRAIRPLKATELAGPTAVATEKLATPSGQLHPRLPTDEDRLPNNLIQSDAPKIMALAKQATGDRPRSKTAADAWSEAVALEKFANQYIAVKNYSMAFSTAVEVAESRTGACTQHAVLLAALARSRGIPARVAIGLVYVDDHPGFAFHMWNEVWIGDQWIPLDATRGLGGIGAAHLKLADSSLQGESAYTCFLPVAQVIGQAKIEILDVQ